MNACWCRLLWWNFSADVNVSSVRSTVTSCISKNIFWKWRNWLTTADVLFLCLFADVHGLDVNDKYLIASSSRWIKFILCLFLLQSQNIFCFVFPFQLPTYRVTQIPWYYCVVVSQGWLIPLLQLCGRWLGVRDWGRGAVRTWWGDNSHQQLSCQLFQLHVVYLFLRWHTEHKTAISSVHNPSPHHCIRCRRVRCWK